MLLLGAVFGLCLHYPAVDENHGRYPEREALVTDFDSHVGAETLVFGTVRSVDSDAERLTIEVVSPAGATELTVRGTTATVDPGGVVQVYGTLEPGRTIDAQNVVVVNSTGGSETYKYAVSAVGAALVVVAFFRHWRVDVDSLSLEVRGGG